MKKEVYKLDDQMIIAKNVNDEIEKDVVSRGGKWSFIKKGFVLPLTYQNLKFLDQNNFNISKDLLYHMNQYDIYFNLFGANENRPFYFTDPYDHQEKLVKYFLNHRKVLFLCGVGTGKSKAAIDSHINAESKKTLVVAPACTLKSFYSQIKQHSNDLLSAIVVDGPIQKRRELLKIDSFDFYIINYDILHRLEKELKGISFDLVIFDEIHFLKNHKSKRSKASYDIAKRIPNRIGLTGTLIESNIQDAFSPCRIIDESIFGKVFYSFRNKYLIMGGFQTRFGPTQVVGYSNIEEFKKNLASISLKFDLDDVLDLPPIIDQVKTFELSDKSRAIYNDMKMGFHEKFDVNSILAQMMNLQKICSGFIENENTSDEKIKTLLSILEEIGNKKVLIWCRFTYSINKIWDLLSIKGYKVYIYDGSTKDKDHYKKFEEDEGPSILISQLQMGVGWEVPSCKYSIFYEMDYSLTHLVQCKGRIRRLKGSQGGSCVYLYLLASNTIEGVIYDRLQTKDFSAQDALEYVQGGNKDG